MKILIVGSGKLATAILSSDVLSHSSEVIPWDKHDQTLNEKTIVVHAGSGRQLPACFEFCLRTDSILIELSTGLETEKMSPDFTLIVCPNTSFLVLKVLSLLRSHGHYFANDQISITESHQSSKTSAPGTAFSFADALHSPIDKIRSIRDPHIQLNEIGIPNDYLDKHAYHKITIKDGSDELIIETKVLGHDSYARGVERIIDLIVNRSLERKRYSILDLIP